MERWRYVHCIFVATYSTSQQYFCAKDWLEETMLHEEMVPRLSSDRRFVLTLLAVQSMDEMFRYLYRGGVWLHEAMAMKISELGRKALNCHPCRWS